jgi:hypothetical protein
VLKIGGGWATPRRPGLGVAEPPPGQTGWPAMPYGVVRPPQLFLLLFSFFFFFFGFFKIKYVMGAFWEENGSKWSNCNNLKVWVKLSVTFETLEVKP